jgi:hypothetical protein
LHFKNICFKESKEELIEMKSPEEITDEIYAAYASGYGHLFGIPPNLRDAVQAVVKVTLQIRDAEATFRPRPATGE